MMTGAFMEAGAAAKIPTLSIVTMGAAVLAVAVIFVGLMIYARRKLKASLKPFFIGCAVFILFALVLESIMHYFVLNVSPAGQTIRDNVWLYALYGGLAAGVFEETGRFIAFKTVLKKSERKIDSVVYGMGHGGVEALLTVGVTYAGYIVMSLVINKGMSGLLYQGVTDPAAIEAMNAQFKVMAETAPGTYLLSIVERLSAITVHISASVLVYAAARRGRIWLYPAAVALHALLDGTMVIIASTGISVIAVEAILAAMSAAVALLAVKVYKSMKDENVSRTDTIEEIATPVYGVKQEVQNDAQD